MSILFSTKFLKPLNPGTAVKYYRDKKKFSGVLIFDIKLNSFNISRLQYSQTIRKIVHSVYHLSTQKIK